LNGISGSVDLEGERAVAGVPALNIKQLQKEGDRNYKNVLDTAG